MSYNNAQDETNKVYVLTLPCPGLAAVISFCLNLETLTDREGVAT
jgi:hypothetical protein